MENNQFFFDASEYASSLRCTIQKSGKIGFSGFTQLRLKINEQMSIRLGIDGQKDNYSHLLLQILDTIEKNAFKINKAGSYYYINPKPLLDELEISYNTKNVLFDMILLDETQRIYKLVKREDKNNKEGIDSDNEPIDES